MGGGGGGGGKKVPPLKNVPKAAKESICVFSTFSGQIRS